MPLHRMREHFRNQNWAGFAIDFIIVVAGVYLGLEAANWNEQRRDRTLEHAYLVRLQDDLQKTIEANREQMDWNTQLEASQKVVIAALQSGELDEQDEATFEQGLLYLGFVGRPRLYWGTVRELQSSGNMNVISDPKLRAAVVELEGNFERLSGDAETEYERIADLRAPIDPRYGVIGHLLSGEEADLERTDIDYDFDQLASDPEIVNRISHIQYNGQLTAYGFRTILEETERLKAMVDEELERFD